MIDTHCHIDFEDFDDDREEVIKRARDKLDLIIASGFNRESNQNVLDISKEYEGFVYPTFGFHPVSSQNSTDEELKDAQNHLIDNLDSIVAVGEVGMDYYYVTDKELRERQQEIFRSFLDIANKYEFPIVMHVRDCEKKAVNIIEDYDNIPYFIFHCYGVNYFCSIHSQIRKHCHLLLQSMRLYLHYHQ